MNQNREPRQDRRGLGLSLSLASSGLTLAICIAIGAALGVWLDKKFNSHGILLIVFLLVGVVAGFKQLIEDVRKVIRNQDREDVEERTRREEERRNP